MHQSLSSASWQQPLNCSRCTSEVATEILVPCSHSLCHSCANKTQTSGACLVCTAKVVKVLRARGQDLREQPNTSSCSSATSTAASKTDGNLTRKHSTLDVAVGRSNASSPQTLQPARPPLKRREQEEPAHRTAQASPGILKSRWKKSRTAERMSTVQGLPPKTVTAIAAVRHKVGAHYRVYDLWSKQTEVPIVSCDRCDQDVPQTMGLLQGAPGGSQFAQYEFLCNACLNGAGQRPL